jgi:hypothetical protein
MICIFVYSVSGLDRVIVDSVLPHAERLSHWLCILPPSVKCHYLKRPAGVIFVRIYDLWYLVVSHRSGV